MTVYTDSAWGYTNQTLTDPTPPADIYSEWGFTTVALSNPSAAADSPWGYASLVLTLPHHPLRVKIGSTGRYVPARTLIGGELR